MGIVDRIKKAITPDEPDYDTTLDEMARNYEDDDTILPENPHIYDDYGPQRTSSQNINPGNRGFSSDLSSPVSSPAPVALKVFKPKNFSEVGAISEQLLERKTIVLNLEETNKETVRRLIDFLSGVAFAVDGKLHKVTEDTLIIMPSGVDITGEHIGGTKPEQQKNHNISNNMFE